MKPSISRFVFMITALCGDVLNLLRPGVLFVWIGNTNFSYILLYDNKFQDLLENK
jgi:hypothetical protein